MRLQVIDAAVEQGLFIEHRSPKGSPKSSRLVPHGKAVDHLASDPWEIEPNRTKQFVFLYTGTKPKQELSFDRTSEVPTFVQQRLEHINQVNSRFVITYESFDKWSGEFDGEYRRLRPIHYAVFSV